MSDQPAFGAIEAGGTKFVCAIGTGPDDVRLTDRFPTTEPSATLDRAAAFFRTALDRGACLSALGIAAFGPIETRVGHPGYGHLLATPKPGWTGADVVTPVASLGLPIGLDTDVVGAALGEGRWGAARGLHSYVYLTVGTGIGGGAIIDGRVARGVPHAEMGHQSVARRPGDTFAGVCPYHGDCLEGLASGPAIAARRGRPAEALSGRELAETVELEAAYLADGLRNIAYVIAPQRIVIGGGVAALPGLVDRVRELLRASFAGYPGVPEHAADDFVAPAALGALAGVLGGFVLAERAAAEAGVSAPVGP
jgi:fructokinase